MTIELFGGPEDGAVLGVEPNTRAMSIDTTAHPCGMVLRRNYYWTPAVSKRGHQVFLFHPAYEVVRET